MAAKTQAESLSRGGGRPGSPTQRREISGILLLAVGLFALMSLLSMHLGDNRLMGPGGAAAAAAIYATSGLGAYLVIAALAVVAVRCFRARPLCTGPMEAIAVLLLLGAVGILLHLPFEDRAVSFHGPGGLLGQWLGEIAATFIGVVGAALAGATMLFVSLLLLSAIRIHEVVRVLGWALRHSGRAFWAGLSAAGRVALAMFPEKDDHRDDEAEAEAEARAAADARYDDEPAIEVSDDDIRAVIAAARPEPAFGNGSGYRIGDGYDADGIPRLRDDDDLSGGVRIGEPRILSNPAAVQRAAFAEVVAEMAAVERRPTAYVDDDDPREAEPANEVARPLVAMPISAGARESAGAADEVFPMAAAATSTAASGEGPIIVEPASRTRQHEAAQGPGFIKLGEGAFKLPPTELLEYLPPQAPDMDKEALYDMAERLEQAMSNYGVRGKVREIHMGPVVTMYEFAPAPGTRTGKIANLEKDLAMALEAQAVRIVAPIPGKAVVGVEVPNKNRETVYLKEILEDACFTGANSKLQVGLGKDIKGAPVSVNLGKMPHLLVAGTTGSGKSVAVNGMITSLLYNSSPEDVRFIMVDPKMLELSIYEGIPHLLLPVVTDPKKANLALRWAVEEMERRYELLAKTGVRDIASYNAKIDPANQAAKALAAAAAAASSAAKKLKVVLAGPDGSEQEIELSPDEELAATNPDGVVEAEAPSDEDLSDQAAAAQSASQSSEPPPRKLPYIVIVIDEFADLMMVAPKDVETSVARLAQKARAAGLHLILATQRPSVDVITGLIKANFPSRIALQVASKIDSRTILDQSGAETLLGNGDMLFSDRGTKLRRIHGAFLSDDEVHRVVDFLKTQAKPVYDMDILKPREEDADDGAPASDFHDEVYDQAVAIVCETRQASVSFIQRRLQIGYNRAARLVEQMEREGIVGPANGAKPREIIAQAGEYLQHAP
jgi:DNA segregation ATPase FtsK/SpoIIIE, S-DNA-T family